MEKVVTQQALDEAASQIVNAGGKPTFRAIQQRVGDTKVFLTFDIDFVDPAYAPGTGTPEVGGFTSWEVLSLVRALKNLHYVGFDIVEVMPGIDQAELTAYLAANIGFEFLSILAFQKKNGLR